MVGWHDLEMIDEGFRLYLWVVVGGDWSVHVVIRKDVKGVCRWLSVAL